MGKGELEWQWLSYEGLSRDQLYKILRFRQAVFAVEQNSVYQDVDGLDQVSRHLAGWYGNSGTKKIAAYLRLVMPGHKYREPAIGRVAVCKTARGLGLGKELLRRAIAKVAQEYPDQSIRISAQQYLEKFYSDFGFETVSDPYNEDGIPHVEMLLAAPTARPTTK